MLSLPQVKQGVPEVVAGERGLGAEVRWVHAAEVSNIASLLKGRELLLTTGMGISSAGARQRSFVGELAARGVAALAIELGTVFEAVPRPMLEAADAQDFCLVAFHREVPFVEITEAVHREIVNHQGELLRRGEELHQRFTSLLLEGARIPDVMQVLASIVDNPVVLERAGRGVAYQAWHGMPEGTVLSAWEAFTRELADAPPPSSAPCPPQATASGGDSWHSG